MRIPRQWRLADACRLVTLTSVLFALSTRVATADVSGTVVDQSGRPVPRAYVRVLESSGAPGAAAFADEAGRFELSTGAGSCRVEATLTGFQPASAPCPTDAAPQPVRLVLRVAPIQ